jgi:hypothetical protein
MPSVQHDDAMLVDRARSEFIDLPGLQLTPSQVQRLIGATPPQAAAVLERLIADGFLRRTRDGRFARASGPHS